MKLKKILQIMKKIFCLPPVLTLLIAIPSYAIVIFVLVNNIQDSALSYLAYILSAYALVITITGMTKIIKWMRQKLLDIPLVEKFFSEAMFRTKTSLYQGVLINFLYAGIKLFSGIYYHSIWFGTLAVYYVLLAAMRFSLLAHMRSKSRGGKDRIEELRRYRLCGILLLFMNEALVGIIILVTKLNSGFQYPGMLIYAMAFYTFYSTIVAAINVIKFRKYKSPVMSAAKVINLTAALVSMLSLETAMLTQFGSANDAVFRQIMTASTGAGVSMIVFGMAIYMIVSSTRQLKNLKELKCL